ncbi:syntaxin-binding protein 5 isoform X2 [Cimex lectularius]|uniref:Syntaxin-binding protein 5-like n=1 Tax=Cimex lectularius TaxID=79782 RepID=A0A8I6SE74_CIMLE|nr:syntaxin-binding protein 5 isoform X2 [Cimex lectularius]
MKKFTFKGVLDGLRSSVSQQPRNDQEIVETLRPENFQVAKTFRHGFPNQPTAVAFDPIQRLLAIGSKNGSLRILGRFGVDCHVFHEGEVGIIQIVFLVNEGALITATTDDSVHLWNFRQKRPDLVHSLQFQRERITCIHLPLHSKWLYVGSERGNIHVVNIESFQLSGYVINWNKAIEVSRKTHPGAVVHLSDNPLDSSKLLIAFESGQLVLWDLRMKVAEARWQSSEPLKSVIWHHDGKQFMTSHTDGTLQTWNIRQFGKPVNILQPHAKIGKDGKPESCKAIQKVEWKAARSGETFVIFCGGLTYDKAGRSPSITIMHGKATTVLEMEHNVIDFITLCESPYASDIPEPYAIVVVLQNDLVVIDLLSPGFPCFESPHPMDVHECPVTCCTYLADCPSDLIPAFYSIGSRSSKRTGFSDKEWPLAGGEWTTPPCSYSEIIITGHADGSIKFWDASCGTLQVLYKVKTNKVFERPQSKSQDGNDDDPFAIQLLSLCPESRKLCIAGAAGYVILFKFKKQESSSETAVLDIPIVYEAFDELECSPETDYSRSNLNKIDSGDNKIFGADTGTPIKVKPGLQKKPPGFQATLVCISPAPITSLGINSSYGLMAYGTDTGAVVVDIVHKICLLNVATPDLYGGADPYQRVPKSPKRSQPPDSDPDRCRSPSIDQGVEVEENISGNTSPHEDAETEPRRRKFNLKKQLSRVDLKLKFQPRNNKRSCSVFYAEKDSADESPTSLSPDDDMPTIKEPETDEKPAVRPSDLALFEERPIPPPRREKKDKEMPKRDTRLLSVPNIKYHPRINQGRSAMIRKINKLDSSFSRSRSSSMSSLENISSEAVQCITFADSYTKKSDPSTFPTLWFGTSLGSVLTVMLNVPSSDIRLTHPVAVGPFGTMFRLKGSILTMSFLDCNGALIPYTFESWKDESKEKQSRSSRANSNSRMSPPGTAIGEVSSCDRQFVVIVSEKQAIVAALPSHNIVYKQQITETDFVVKAEIISLKESVCLVCYISNGHIVAYSLPSLRTLIDTDFLPLADLSFQTRKPGIVDPMLSIWGQQMFVNEDTDQIARTFSFSNHGNGLYLCSPTEIQKFSVSADFCSSLSEMVGELFLPHDMPEPPKESFFKGLFGGGARSLDREELFGEASSGKASRTIAKHIPGIAGLDSNSQKACGEIAKAHQMVVERGEKLSQLEERTARMMNEAETFQSSAHGLMLKYKDKKWYQI